MIDLLLVLLMMFLVQSFLLLVLQSLLALRVSFLYKSPVPCSDRFCLEQCSQ
jgi:hypothetical protein